MHLDFDTVIIRDAQAKCFLHFSNPLHVIQTDDTDQVCESLRKVEQAARDGFYAAGMLCYEAAAAFDKSLITAKTTKMPLLWFGIYKQPQKIQLPQPGENDIPAPGWEMSVSKDDYFLNIEKIKRHLSAGNTYQINYTSRVRGRLEEDFYSLFCRINQAQDCEYGAFINTEKWAVASASPELFFSRRGRKITSKPMKGTAPRGLTLAEDHAQRDWLHNSVKNRAENLMIVDMVRNDFGRIAESGTVKVSDMFKAEKYPTLWQLTTTVEARTNASLCEIFAATFPAASITGAPKIAAMKIINDLEDSPRGIYTGSIGFIRPGGDAQFNVAIRTLELDKKTQDMRYGVGGGIVWDSEPDAEFAECKVKTLVLSKVQADFSLLETLLWQKHSGFYLLNAHLDRMNDSAQYFGFEFDREGVRRQLYEHGRNFSNDQRVRLTVSKNGTASIESGTLQALPARWKIRLADKMLDRNNVFLYHKTTNRKVYEQALTSGNAKNYNDVLLYNERGELTESSIANIALKINGRLLTPPVKSGLLPGIYRAELLRQKKISEAVLTLDDLKQCEELWLFNSVRKMWRAVLTGF